MRSNYGGTSVYISTMRATMRLCSTLTKRGGLWRWTHCSSLGSWYCICRC